MMYDKTVNHIRLLKICERLPNTRVRLKNNGLRRINKTCTGFREHWKVATAMWLRFHALLQVPDFVNITESKSACSSP